MGVALWLRTPILSHSFSWGRGAARQWLQILTHNMHKHVRMHARARAHTHTHALTHTHIHTHTCTHTRMPVGWVGWRRRGAHGAGRPLGRSQGGACSRARTTCMARAGTARPGTPAWTPRMVRAAAPAGLGGLCCGLRCGAACVCMAWAGRARLGGTSKDPMNGEPPALAGSEGSDGLRCGGRGLPGRQDASHVLMPGSCTGCVPCCAVLSCASPHGLHGRAWTKWRGEGVIACGLSSCAWW